MAGDVEEGRPWGFIGLVAVIVVGAFIFILVITSGSGTKAELPALGNKGLAWAVDDLKDAGFDSVAAHDAWGRNRSSSDDKDWKVCFQSPPPGELARDTTVHLGVALVTQPCPTAAEGLNPSCGGTAAASSAAPCDQGVKHQVQAVMPGLRLRTAYMTREDFGADASLRFVSKAAGKTELVDDDLGAWQVCAQDVPAGSRFYGQPVTLDVVPYGQCR